MLLSGTSAFSSISPLTAFGVFSAFTSASFAVTSSSFFFDGLLLLVDLVLALSAWPKHGFVKIDEFQNTHFRVVAYPVAGL